MKINTNNDSLEYIIRREIDVLSIDRILDENGIKWLPYSPVKNNLESIVCGLNTIKNICKETFPSFDEDLMDQRMLGELSNALNYSMDEVLEDKSYTAHVLAVYILSIFCLFPSLMEREKVYYFLRELRKECII